MASPFRPEQITAAPFVHSYRQTPDRMRPRPLSPDELTDRARALLIEQGGASGQEIEAAFAHGAFGILSGHTHYFDGFALLMCFEQGTAVAIRETASPQSVLFFDGDDTRWTFDLRSAKTK